jgi:hypothetical protein
MTEAIPSPFIKASSLTHEGRTLMTQSLLKVTPSNTVAWRIKFQHRFLEGTKPLELLREEEGEERACFFPAE